MAASNAAQIETANNHLSDHEMRTLARELQGCEQRKDCTPIAQAYMDKHLANKETFEKVCEVSMDACKIMASEMYDAIYKFQTLGYYSELEGQAADILLAFQQMNLQAKQDASGTITLPTAEAMVEAMGFNPKDEKAKAIILTIAAVVAGKAAGGARGAGAVAETAIQVPGRVQSRVNLMTGDKSSGWEHVVNRHFNSEVNASQFTIGQNELRTLLQSKEVVSAPVTRILQSEQGVRYVREVNLIRDQSGHPPIVSFRFKQEDQEVISRLKFAVEGYDGKVKWILDEHKREGFPGTNWTIGPIRLWEVSEFACKLDIPPSQYLAKYEPEFGPVAYEDIVGLTEHIQQAFSEGK